VVEIGCNKGYEVGISDRGPYVGMGWKAKDLQRGQDKEGFFLVLYSRESYPFLFPGLTANGWTDKKTSTAKQDTANK
jgi:hypothetical protein